MNNKYEKVEKVYAAALELDNKVQNEDLYVQAVIRDVVNTIEEELATGDIEKVLINLITTADAISPKEITLQNILSDLIAVAEQNLV